MEQVKLEKDWVDGWNGLDERLSDLHELHLLAEEEEDEGTLREVATELGQLDGSLEDLELRHMLGQKEDRLDAILTIHPGAGGTESADWAQILVRMYLRWTERRGFQTEVLDMQPGETAGIKSATVEIRGSNVYGNLKSERGVHRLVRISPFDGDHARHHLGSGIVNP